MDKTRSLSQPAPPNLEVLVLNPDNSISFADINRILRESYNFESNYDSTALDVMALYLKGQKIIYTESKTLCEKRLNTLMLPAIFISAVCSILNFILKDYPFGTTIISCFNAFNSFLLALISYLKLDGKAEAHKSSAHKYQKLEAKVEFQSGKSLFFHNSVDVLEFVNEIEKEVMDVRESNQFIPPEHIRVLYPIIYDTNVFSLVKDIQNTEITVINRLKTVVQQLHSTIAKRRELEEQGERIRKQIEEIELELLAEEKLDEQLERERGLIMSSTTSSSSSEDTQESKESRESKEYLCIRRLNEFRQNLVHNTELQLKVRQTLERLEDQKNAAFDKAVEHRQKYLKLSDTFKTEIDSHNERRSTRWCQFLCNPCDWFKT